MLCVGEQESGHSKRCTALTLSQHTHTPNAQAIDLIDEAGSRVRLRHIQLPEEARELDKELKQVCAGGV
jgi:ATP-dependent Clp protease ATP-binding subunit ClpA